MSAMRFRLRGGAAIWLLLAATLFLRSFVPQGYMPDRAPDGAIFLRLCDSIGTKLVRLGLDAGRHDRREHRHDRGHEKGEQHASQPCAFAGLTGPTAPPPPVPAIRPPAGAALLFEPGRAAEPGVAMPRPLPPARAPPLPA